MPLIVLTVPNDTLADEAVGGLVEQLSEAVRRWEGIADRPAARAAIWTLVDRRAIYAGGTPSPDPRYLIRVTVAAGSLPEDRRAGLVGDMTRLVLEAEGASDDAAAGMRVWCHVHELPDGHWGSNGQLIPLRVIAQFAGIDPASLPALAGA